MWRSACLTILCLLPAVGHAVSISEVAWMGDTVSANNEWIELYNNTGSDVSVEGWTLKDGQNLTITLTGTIPANTYRLLERSRGSGAYINNPPFVVYSGALINTGATLTLRRADGTIVDQVAGGENWSTIGGDNVTKETAQYTSMGWRTGTPTPGVQNIVGTTQPTATSSTTTTSGAASRYNSGGTLAVGTPAPVVTLAVPNLTLLLRIEAPATAYVNQPIVMQVIPSGLGQTWLNSLVYRWNFGDLATSSGQKVTHTYAYPGTYAVVIEGVYQRHRQTVRHDITILPVNLSLAWSDEGAILLHNDAPYDVDISRYRLVGTVGKRVPPQTIIPSRSTVTIAAQHIQTPAGSPLTLFDAVGDVVATYPSAVKKTDTPQPPPTPSSSETRSLPAPAVTTESFPATAFSTTSPVNTAVLPLIPAVAANQDSLPPYVIAALADPAPLVPAGSHTPWWPYAAHAGLLRGVMATTLVTSPSLRSNQ